MRKLNQANRVATVIAIAAIAIVAIALVSPAVRAQDGVNTPMSSPSSVPAMGEGTVGNSIRADHAADASAPAARPASSDDMSGDSISVTGGVPGSTTSGAATSAPAAPAEASAPAPAAPAEASVPAAAAPAEASAPEAPPPAEASAPANAQPAVSATTPEAPPVTASEPAPAAVSSVAPAPEAAAASISTPVTTAAMPPSGTLAPPMVLAPVPAEVAPEPAPSPAIAPAAAEQAPRPSEQTAGKSGRGQAKDTKVASNEPQENNPTGLQFGNNKGPIHIKSESMSLDYQNHSVLWTGHVHAEQANAQLTSDKLRVNYLDKDFKQLKDMVADGNVRMSQGTQWATGEHGVMDQIKRTMVLTGSPVVHDCANQITGKRITVYLDTNRSVVEDARAVIFPHSGKGGEDTAPTPGCQ